MTKSTSSTSNSKELSAFGQAATALDQDFIGLETLSAQMDRLTLETDADLERAKKILGSFGECAGRVGERLQTLASTLDESRARAEQAASRIAVRAAEVQAKQELSDQLTERFNNLSQTVGKINAMLVQMKSLKSEEPTKDEMTFFSEKLPELDMQMGTLSEAAKKLKEEAHLAGMRTIERNSDSLSQTLSSARRKLGAFAPTVH